MTTVSTDTNRLLGQQQQPLLQNSQQNIQPTGITIQDLQNLLTLVDLAATRGAYRANELSRVGNLFDKVSVFVMNASPANIEEQSTNTGVKQPIAQVNQSSLQQSYNTPAATTTVAPPFTPKTGV